MFAFVLLLLPPPTLPCSGKHVIWRLELSVLPSLVLGNIVHWIFTSSMDERVCSVREVVLCCRVRHMHALQKLLLLTIAMIMMAVTMTMLRCCCWRCRWLMFAVWWCCSLLRLFAWLLLTCYFFLYTEMLEPDGDSSNNSLSNQTNHPSHPAKQAGGQNNPQPGSQQSCHAT